MTGRQWFFASLIIVGLLAVIWWGFRPTDDPFDVAFPETTTTAATTPTTTTTTSAPTTTTPEPTTTTTTAEQRLEEVREIMENLWVGWFTEIAEGDSDGLWAYAATSRHTTRRFDDASLVVPGIEGVRSTSDSRSARPTRLSRCIRRTRLLSDVRIRSQDVRMYRCCGQTPIRMAIRTHGFTERPVAERLRPDGPTGDAMRLAALDLVALMDAALSATANEQLYCWIETVTGCSWERRTPDVAGMLAPKSSTYASTSDVPVTLYPDFGSDVGGACWYWRGAFTSWVILNTYPNNVVDLGWDPDGIPGGVIALDASGVNACTSEPIDAPADVEVVYDLVRTHTTETPEPEISPDPAISGLTGLDTYVGVVIPPQWDASIVSPFTGAFLEAQVWVDAVEIDWGDDETTVIPRDLLDQLTGWPDGILPHIYETKTCLVPGSQRACHPTLSAYPLSVTFVYTGQWRADGGAWQILDIADTNQVVDYNVNEIRGVLTTPTP